MRSSATLKLALFVAGSTLVLPPLAFAQTTAPATPSAADESIVTAQRRSEALQDVPISISVASGKTLETVALPSFKTLD